jgi:hypothetical protein
LLQHGKKKSPTDTAYVKGPGIVVTQYSEAESFSGLDTLNAEYSKRIRGYACRHASYSLIKYYDFFIFIKNL